MIDFVDIDKNNKFKHKSPPSSEFSVLFQQIWLMMRKNFLIYRRNYRQSLFLLLSPVLIFILITVQQSIANISINVKIINPAIKPVPNIARCLPPKNVPKGDCVTVGYGVVGDKEAWIDYVMDYVAKVNDLQLGSDVKQISSGTVQNYMEYLAAHPNRTQIGVLFCTGNWDIYGKISVPC